MKTTSLFGIRLVSFLAFAVLGFGCAEYSMGPGTSPGSGPTTGVERAASGTSGDTLQACLNRIPSTATDGQRMLAKKSCERDDRNREAIKAVPGQ